MPPPVDLVRLASQILKQSGVGALLAIVIGFALVRVYSDLVVSNHELVLLVREDVGASRAVVDSLRELSDLIADRARREGQTRKP